MRKSESLKEILIGGLAAIIVASAYLFFGETGGIVVFLISGLLLLSRWMPQAVPWALWGLIATGIVWALIFPENGGFQPLVDGIRFGAILMLGAIGLTLTYRILNFANFSHGDILLFGAYVALSFDYLFVGILPQIFPSLGEREAAVTLRWIAIVMAIPFGVIGAILISLVIDRVIYKKLRRSAAVVLVIASFGMALFIRSLIQMFWGRGNQRYAMRVEGPHDIDILGFIQFKMTTTQFVTIIVAFTLIFLLHLFLTRTRRGKAMRAMSDNSDLARVSGINTDTTIRWTWAIGAGLAAIGGIFSTLNFGAMTPNLGQFLLLPLFSAVILGGIGSPYGAMLGALVIGIAQTILIAPVTEISTAYKPGVAFLLMIIMLLIRPQGLLGSAGRKG